MKPLISYYGGKQRLAPQILPLIPEHQTYVEPFAGGASILFAKSIPRITNYHHYREVLNDHDKRVITLYRVCQTRYLELLHLLEWTPYSEDEHQKAKEILNTWDQHDELWQAWAFYVKITTSFSNVLHGGWRRAAAGPNPANKWHEGKARLAATMSRLARVHFACADAVECILQWDSPETFFYCDPPYVGANQGHYGGYTDEDLAKLCSVLDSVNGDFLLSTYPSDAIPTEWESILLEAFSSAGAANKGTRPETIYRKRKDRTKGEGQLSLLQNC